MESWLYRLHSFDQRVSASVLNEYGSRTTINTIATNRDRAIEFPVVFEPRERHLGYIDSTFLRPGSASVLSEHRMDAIRTTVKTIDTNRDTATEFPRQQPSSLTHESR